MGMSVDGIGGQIVDIVEDCISTMVEDVKKTPLLHYSEYDLHKLLYHDILTEMKKKGIETFPTSFPSKEMNLETLLVHSEFANPGRARAPIDMVILHSDDLKKINSNRFKHEDENINPFIAIEMKTELNVGSRREIVSHLMDDLKRLRQSDAKHCFFIVVYRDDTKNFVRKDHIEKIDKVNITMKKMVNEHETARIHGFFIHIRTNTICELSEDWVECVKKRLFY